MPTTIKELVVKFVGDTTGVDRSVNDVNSKLKASSAKFGDEIRSTSSAWAAGIATGLAGIGVASVKAYADFQALTMGLRAVAGSSGAAEQQLGRLKEVAKLPGLGLEEAIRGSIRLQSVGLSASQAERAIKGFGNALATVGYGKAELDGVIVALTQIMSKGKVSAEEINQIAERVPQIRSLMQSAFGTADTMALQQMGISPAAFVEKITAELEKLPKVMGGMKNDFENIQDSIKALTVSIGQMLAPAVKSILKTIQDLIDGWNGMSEGMKAAIVDLAKMLVTAYALSAGFGILKGVMASITATFAPLLGLLNSGISTIAKITSSTMFFVKALGLQGLWLSRNSGLWRQYGFELRAFAASAASFIAKFAAIGIIITAISQFASAIREANSGLKEEINTVDDLNRRLDDYKKKLDAVAGGVTGAPKSKEQGKNDLLKELRMQEANSAKAKDELEKAKRAFDYKEQIWGEAKWFFPGSAHAVKGAVDSATGDPTKTAYDKAIKDNDEAFAKLQAVRAELKKLGYNPNGQQSQESMLADNAAKADLLKKQSEAEKQAESELWALKMAHVKGKWAGERAEIEVTYKKELAELNKIKAETGEDISKRASLAKAKYTASLADSSKREKAENSDLKKQADDEAKRKTEELKEKQRQQMQVERSEYSANMQARAELLRDQGKDLQASITEAQLSYKQEMDSLNDSAANGESVVTRKIAAWVKYALAVKKAMSESIKAQQDETQSKLEKTKDSIDAIKQETEAIKQRELSRIGFTSLTSIWQKAMEVGAAERYYDPVKDTSVQDKSREYDELKKQNDLLKNVVDELQKANKQLSTVGTYA